MCKVDFPKTTFAKINSNVLKSNLNESMKKVTL
jgi:hypothetical protein